ncbi:MAG: hypothetical protein U0670_04365 [Anaerolineae bacterium]
MRRNWFAYVWVVLSALIALSAAKPAALAQSVSPRAQAGDPPIASLITMSTPDEDGLVTITGASGSVPPNGTLVVRNLYTGETARAPIGVAGTFNIRVPGGYNTPFWLSPSPTTIPGTDEINPGSLPGAQGTILWSAFPDGTRTPVAELALDGDLSDWDAYPEAAIRPNVYALRTQEAGWIGVRDAHLSAARGDGAESAVAVRVVFTMNGNTFAARADLFDPLATTFERTNPNQRALDVPPITSIAVDGAAEVRIPLNFLDRIESFNVVDVQLIAADGSEIMALPVDSTAAPTPVLDLPDGVFRLEGSSISRPTAFELGGPLGNGAAIWTAQGQVSPLRLASGDQWHVEMDVTLHEANLPRTLNLWVGIALQPISGDANGRVPVSGDGTNNGWTSALFNGLPVDNVAAPLAWTYQHVQPHQLITHDDRTEFSLDLTVDIPTAADGFLPGYYVARLQAFALDTDPGDLTQVTNDEALRWEVNPIFGQGDGVSRQSITRLPFVLNLGNVNYMRLPVALFYDSPSDGSRGVISSTVSSLYGISNRVKFNAPTYILPPFRDGTTNPLTYSLEPYVMNVLANAYDSDTAPLVPFDFAEGSNALLSVQVTLPDGTDEVWENVPIVQGVLSTTAQDERSRFGAQSPVDEYRLTTHDSTLTQYTFDQYGTYTIEETVRLSDRWGNLYTSTGSYEVLIAETFDMTPAVLPGTPFEVGNVFHPGVTIMPGAAADVTLTLTVYPLDGGTPIVRTIDGQSDAYGNFVPNADPIIFDTPGMYTADYEARFTDAYGRLWASSLRGVGLIASPDTPLVAHGQRGIPSSSTELNETQPLAWYRASAYPNVSAPPTRLQFPFFSGDVAWIGENAEDGLQAAVRVQDLVGTYADHVVDTLVNDPILRETVSDEIGSDIGYVRAGGELPVHEGYAFVSAVRPGLALRQFITAGAFDGLPLWWDSDDPYNGQIGAGTTGDRPGDYTFLFGGALIQQADVQTASIYGALSVVIDSHDAAGSRIFPPLNGTAGGGNGGSLVAIDDREFDMFFVPSGTPPGALLRQGETISIAGQVAPTIPAAVRVTITSPSGVVTDYDGRANAVGYFYDPVHDFAADEIGVWTIDIQVTGDVTTSAGEPRAPYLTGGVLRPQGTSYNVYVLSPDSEVLRSNIQRGDTIIPTGTFNFTFTVPADWTDTQGYVTLRTPSYILYENPVRASGRTIAYQFNPGLIRGSFPNVENEPRGSGSSVVDPMTLTIVATGRDPNGQLQIQGRQITLFYNRLMQITDGDFSTR